MIDATSCSSLASGGSAEAWSEPSAKVCEHTLTLQQAEETSDNCETCSKCELKSNLWKCLTCGTLSCGRRQFDGSGGNGHALEHFEATGHALAVKLGTIAVKADGLEADVYCYSCDDMVLDPELNAHLSVLGIDPKTSRKTEKSTAELNLDINLTHSYAMTDASGSELKELTGPWLRGFTNLGNSCYLASVMQALRNLDRESFLAHSHSYMSCSTARAAECISCQLSKLYSGLSSEQNITLRPWMFKTMAAGTSSEFNSGRQQDASEFLSHLLQNRFKRVPELAALTKAFELELEEVVVCGGCGHRRVSSGRETALILSTPDGREDCDLDELLQNRFSPESVDWRCDGCNASKSSTFKQSKITALPSYLVIVANRLKLKNWVPEKTECHISGMDQELSLEQFCDKKSASNSSNANAVTADPVLLGELLMMGIEEDVGRKALIACKNSSVDAAMNFIFEGGANQDPEDNTEAVDTLMAAGFSQAKAKQALEATSGDLERAFDWIFSHAEEPNQVAIQENMSSESIDFKSKYQLNSFITHKGNSVFCGHYVVHLKDNSTGKWILFNDEKVAEAAEDESFPIKDAYIYIYKKV